MFEIKNLSVNYGGIEAVRDISFSVEEGSIVTLIGANGAGKSTLVKCIDRIRIPCSGDVLIDASTTPSLPLLCLAVRSRASFKIGVTKGEENPFHLQILMPDSSAAGHPDGGASPAAGTPLDAGGLLKNALFYWKKIGVKENNL